MLERLPHRALGHLAVSAEHPHVRWEPVEEFRGEAHADPDGKALAERARRDVDPRDDRRRMPFEHAAELAVGEELIVADRPNRAEDRVVQGRRMTLRED